MKLEFKLIEEDFLNFQLFTASKSDIIIKKERNGRILLSLGTLATAIYFYFDSNMAMTIYFGVLSIVLGLYYPKYFRWRYKHYFKRHIREHYSNRFGEIEYLEIKEDTIFTKDKTAEGTLFLSEVEEVVETDQYFYLKISSGLSLIIPKRDVSSIDEVRRRFRENGFSITDESNWSWK